MNNQILNLIARAIGRRVDDSASRQSAQVEVTKGELIDGVPRIQDYGLTSVPPVEGSDAIVLFLGGNREQGIIVAMENRQFRLTGLEAGEVALYDDLGNVFKLGREMIEVEAVTKVQVRAPIVDVEADGGVTLTSGASSIQVTPAGVAITSPSLTHNGKQIGATHYHVGSPNTAVPV